ncbi:MAG TPA: DUF6508 domain-containing protein [Chthonomonadaceae bacterium]|nr:DUF6508 domain-containing protein [Chthonomonadaceae bacterium]
MIDEMQPSYSEEILIGVAKLLDKQVTSVFSYKAVQDELCISTEEWEASYNPTFQAMQNDYFDVVSALLVEVMHENMLREGANDKYMLTEHGKQLLEELQQQKTDELLQFQPLLEQCNGRYIVKWGGGQKLDNGAIQWSYPIYDESVSNFFHCAGHSYWSDCRYKPEEAERMLKDKELICTATIGQFRTMLTYCVRGERFCEGHWATMLENGKVQALLYRLQQMKTTWRDNKVMPSQRDLMRALVQKYGLDEERVIREYANAEQRGKVKRKSNKHGITSETYARALFKDAIQKRWLNKGNA